MRDADGAASANAVSANSGDEKIVAKTRESFKNPDASFFIGSFY